MPWDQTTHQKIAMPMTAASIAQRRMGLKASIWDNEGVPSALVSNKFSRGLWLSQHDPGPPNCNDILCSSWSVYFEITLERPVMLIRGELRAVIRRLWLQSPG